MARQRRHMAENQRLAYPSVLQRGRRATPPAFRLENRRRDRPEGLGHPVTILRPNNYYQNDYLFQDARRSSACYPQPIGGVGISRVDVRDIAESRRDRPRTAGGHEGETTYNPSPHVWHRHRGTAETVGRALGAKSIAATPATISTRGKPSLSIPPPGWCSILGSSYAFFQKSGLKATGADYRPPDKTPRARAPELRTSRAETASTPGGHKYAGGYPESRRAGARAHARGLHRARLTPFLLDDAPWVAELARWAREMPRPKAVLMVSAHWEERPVSLGATRTVPLVYDFYAGSRRSTTR